MECPAKIRPFSGNEIELVCESQHEQFLDQHFGILRDYAYKGSQTIISWYEDDRRTYRGEWPGVCGKSTNIFDTGRTCQLPKNHPRGCDV